MAYNFHMPNCWICGALADSREHMVKASDFRSVFRKVTQHAPAYRHSAHKSNQPIRGDKADILKFAPSLCGYCNNTQTQQHDLAWQKLSESIRTMRPSLCANSRIPLQRIFPGSVKNSMRDVHLYFTKLFGCYAVEHKVPLPITYFALCIKDSVPPPNLRLAFISIPSDSARYRIQVGDIRALNIGSKTVSAVWFYAVGTLGVVVSYNETGHLRLSKERGWHPDDKSTRLVMR
jgi:hypothetical protein